MNSLLMKRRDLFPSSLLLSRSWRPVARGSFSHTARSGQSWTFAREVFTPQQISLLPSSRCFSSTEDASFEIGKEDVKFKIENVQSPIHAINLYYFNRHQFQNVNSYIQAEQNDYTFWTATFVCPVTGEKFPAGTLRDSENQGTDKNGLVMYRKKSLACHAACARALDKIQYRSLGIAEPRLCEEDPAVEIIPHIDDRINAVEEQLEGPDAETQAELQAMGLDVESVNERDTLDPNQAAECDFAAIHENALLEEGTDEDEHLSIVELNDCGKAPYEKVFEKLSPATPVNKSSSPSEGSMLHPDHRRRAAIAAAEAWLASFDSSVENPKSPHHVVLFEQLPQNNVNLGKSILRNLAIAHQLTPRRQSEQGETIEQLAIKVLQVLHSSKEFKPDAEIYTYYIKCLEGTNPSATARKAKKIVDTMKSGGTWNMLVLPKPDISTMNALIQIFAQIGGQEGRCADVYDSFEPNTESFLCLLSSLAYQSTVGSSKGFDAEFALECIQNMKDFNKSREAESQLVIDTKVYNAPLRWTGASHWYSSRPYARSIPWDKYHILYSNGCGDNTESKMWIEAQQMDEWRRMMISFDDPVRAPNLETDEAVIQAWVRTTTLTGLEKAGQLAQEVIEKYSNNVGTLRLQTFLPIFAGWLHSQSPEAPIEIKALMDTLNMHVKSHPEVEPDGRVTEAYIAALVARQVCLSNDRNEMVEEQRLARYEDLHSCAVHCSETLRALWQSEQNQTANRGIVLDSLSFALTINAWYRVAVESKNASVTKCALREMLNVVELFEETVTRHVVQHQNHRKPVLSAQGISLVRTSNRILDSFIVCMTFLERERVHAFEKSDQAACANTVSIIIERLLRRACEFREIEHLQMEDSEEQFYVSEGDATSYPKTVSSIFSEIGHSWSSDFFTFGLEEIYPCPTTKDMTLWKLASYVSNWEEQTSMPAKFGRMRLLALIRETFETKESPLFERVNGMVNSMLMRNKNQMERGESSTRSISVKKEAPRVQHRYSRRSRTQHNSRQSGMRARAKASAS